MGASLSIFGTSRAMRASLRFSNSLRADGLISTVYSATKASALDQIRFDHLEEDAFLFAPPFRNHPIVEILPDCTVLAEVDLHGHFAAFLVGQKLDASHDLPPFAA
jgi:hypothetical protein